MLPLAVNARQQHSIVCTAKCDAASDLETHARTVVTRQFALKKSLRSSDGSICLLTTDLRQLRACWQYSWRALHLHSHLTQAEHSRKLCGLYGKF